MATTVEGEEAAAASRRHVLAELGWEVTPGDGADAGMTGAATVVPEMHAPGTPHLRTSILAAWADVLAGYLAVETVRPRVPVTLELDVHLYRPAPGTGAVRGAGRVIKSGRSVFVASVDFFTDSDEHFGFAAASFMASPDARLTIPTLSGGRTPLAAGTRLTVPFAERAGCERRGPGVAVLAHSDEVLNSSNTINGGLIALAVEEAVLSLAPGTSLASLDLRYLQPARIGPVVASAEVRHGLGRVEVRDEGNENRLCVAATTRSFDTE
ncbi:MAG TPA: hotdog domain-containing protein [Acidimicrobiales bacterium]|jgi:acyl-coenzyme A thioesterase PaaI-like protein